ncbi:hypothetical protein HK105_209364 [Polyrhizophydium stewartii]|uniref:Uncharacterized protein n=1 Tax=Polyrhizophydium stewartii TaxID=2732419 RepID=A0ABR4MV74_9FUNG
MEESALFMRLLAFMKLSGADKELREAVDALTFLGYTVMVCWLLKALLLLFELLSRIFVTVASWRGKIQADAKAKAEASANVDKLKTGGEAKRAKRSKKAKRPHLNDKNASPTTLSNSCQAHPGTTASMHELNVAARPLIFEIAPMHTNNTRPQSLSAASNQPARSLDEISGLAGSRNINTDGVSAAIINKLDKATLSIEHLCMDAAQAPSSARRVPATLALATAAETSASIPLIDDEINTPLDDDLAESHTGGEVGVTEVAVEQPLVADNTGVIQAGSTPVSVPIVMPALNISTMLVGTIGAENLLEIGNTGVIQAISLPVSVLIVVPALNISTMLVGTIGAENLLVADGTGHSRFCALRRALFNVATMLENTIDAENLLVADGTGVIQAASTPDSVPCGVPLFNVATMLENTIDAENLLVADGTGMIQAASTPDSVPCGVPLFNVATMLENTIDADNLLVADGTGVIQAASIPDSNTIDAENLLVADGTGVIQAASIPDSVPCGVPLFNVATMLENTIDAENLLVADGTGVIQAASIPDSNLLVADGTGVIQAASIPDSVPCGVPLFNITTALENTIDADNLLVADGTGVIQAASTPDSVPCGVPLFNVATMLQNTIVAENLLVADGTGVIQAASTPDSVPCGVPLFNVATMLENTIGAENLLVADGTGVIQAASIPDSVPCGVPLFNVAALEASNSPENESSASDAASVPALEESRRDVPIRLAPDWTYAKTIKLIRGSIDQFMVEMDKPSDSLRPEFWKPPADQILFEKAYALLVAALCPAIVDKCRPVRKPDSEEKRKPDSKEKRKQPEPAKPNQAITPLRRAAQHATHTNFTRKPESRLATAFKYLRPAYPLIVVPFDPKDDEKPAAPLPVSLTDYGKFLAQHGAVEEPSEPELNEAMLDASHEYHEFVACCFAELCDAIFSNSNNPQEQRAIIDEQLGRFWVATRKKSRVCEFKKSLYKMVPNPPTDRNGAETGGGCPCRN